MIKSANQYPIHTLFSYEAKVFYRIPPYQREYSWYTAQWENLFEDLIEADGSHFLGTIITLDQTTDALDHNMLEVVDGQQRLTTLALLLAAVYSILKEHLNDVDDDTRTDVVNLGRRLVDKSSHQLRVIPQHQGQNVFDYRRVLHDAGLPVEEEKKPYYPSRRIAKCYHYFRSAILKLAETEELTEVEAALKVHAAALKAVVVKIEVASHADAFVLFESLNNRGMPLSPVDLIKNHLLAESEKKAIMNVDQAFKHWNSMLINLGDSYSTQERFLRHYYNAFKSDLPDVPNAFVATKSNLIRIYETLLAGDFKWIVDDLVNASSVYGRINCVLERDQPTSLDRSFQRLMRVQGAPSYVLLMWLMTKQHELELSEDQMREIVDCLTSFFVRRNLTGYPPTYVLAKLFMTTIAAVGDARGTKVMAVVGEKLNAVSSSDEEFRARLLGPIYEENTNVARFVLAALAEDAMTKETKVDLWRQEKGHFVWTIEHILPQGENLTEAWQEMLGGKEQAAQVQGEHRHRLGNLTITAYNSNLGNKSFIEKRDRRDSKGLYIGYRNGLSLNDPLATSETWTAESIDNRTEHLAAQVVARFPLSSLGQA